MAPTQIFVLLFAILASSIYAQEVTDSDSGDNTATAAAASSASSLFKHSLFENFNFDFSAFWPGFNSSAFLGRKKRSLENDSQIEHNRNKRSVVRCNFLTQGGFRCTGCRQVRRCYPFNLATITTCSGFLPYCNNGLCSRTKGSLCYTTTSSTTDSSSTSSSSSSTESSSSSSSSTDSSSSSSSSSTDSSSSSSSSSTDSSSSSSTDSSSSSSTDSSSSSSTDSSSGSTV